MHNIPIDLLIVRNVEVIGSKIGRLVKVDEQWIKYGLGRVS